MSSFRQYGGINRAATNNIIRNRYSNSDNPTISNYLGQPNSKIVSESHLDLSGNSILNVNGIYFTNRTNITITFCKIPSAVFNPCRNISFPIFSFI